MGPNYLTNSEYDEKLENLESGKLDETYCFLYVPNDVNNGNTK